MGRQLEGEVFASAHHASHPEVYQARDGKTVLTMKVRGTIELRNWVFGFGPWLEVLKPIALREEVAGLPRTASRNYT
jgi:WYL domain